jgi:ABC-2 type transport system permease protein
MYPNTLFSGGARVLLYTLIPAFFVGAMPVEIIKSRSISMLWVLILAVALIWAVAIGVFYWGLRRYESGSAINVNL